MKASYPCMSLHGGEDILVPRCRIGPQEPQSERGGSLCWGSRSHRQWSWWKCSDFDMFVPLGIDQYDRDSIINDFKNGACRLMVATSVAARGLDVKQLILVVNYNCPNHYEDYVHRAGRTGRAGNKVIQRSCCCCWLCFLCPFPLLVAAMISFLLGLCLHFHHRRPGAVRWWHHQGFGAVGLFCPSWTGTALGVV